MKEETAVSVLAMIQTLAREMLEVGGSEPYSHLAHKFACEEMMKVLRFIAEQEDVK